MSWGQNLSASNGIMFSLVVYFFFFFFQAEDGIRDTSVTGVQTCALPISEAGALGILQCRRHLVRRAIDETGFAIVVAGPVEHRQVRREVRAELGAVDQRSEERRVGKECRCRWVSGHERKRG